MKVYPQVKVSLVNTPETIQLHDTKLPAGVNIVREREYGEYMATTNKQWREHHVAVGKFSSWSTVDTAIREGR